MDRKQGRQRLVAVTAVVGAGAAAIAALVGFTRPAPSHTAPAVATTGDTSGDHQQGSDQAPGPQGVPPQGGGGRPDAVSSGS